MVDQAGVAKGTFYTHFNDLNELAATVANELIHSFDELIQPQRLSTSDPVVRIAFSCSAFMEKALQDRSWASLAARMARSYQQVGQVGRSRLAEDLREALKRSPQPGLSLELALEVAIGVVLQVLAAIGEGRLADLDPPEAVRCILAAIGVGKREAASGITQVVGMRRSVLHRASSNAEDPRVATARKSPAPLKRANPKRV